MFHFVWMVFSLQVCMCTTKVETSDFFGDSVVSWYFSGNCLIRVCFCWSKHMGRCFTKNRHILFSWRQPGKRACNVFLEEMLEKTQDVWKAYKYQWTMLDDTGTPCHCWALMTLVFTDNTGQYWYALPFFVRHCLSWFHREKRTKKLLVVFW